MARLSKVEFDRIVQSSLFSSLRMVGEDCFDSVLSFVHHGKLRPTENLHLDLLEVDRALDTLYSRFSKVIKYVTVLQISSLLKQEPPRLKESLFWMVEELRAEAW